MKRGREWRGQPVLALAALLLGWLALRVTLWEPPFAGPLNVLPGRDESHMGVTPLAGSRPVDGPRKPAIATVQRLAAVFAPSRPAAAVAGGAAPPSAIPPALAPLAGQAAQRAVERRPSPAVIDPPRLVGGSPDSSPRRWSSDSWLLLRRDTTTPVTSGRGSYGRSQVGTVLRYRLAPASGHRPTAFVRASAAVSGRRELEVAAGFAARPLPGVPIVLAGEMRAGRFGGEVETRPAAFAYSELPPLELPLGARAEAYVQGGYVGGRYATGFIDGQVRIERALVRLGPAELRAGAGLWGGAQKGAKRADAGPSVTLALDLGGVPLRVTGDWRFRIAGDANPGSGPALIVATGF